jgi:uncharacterized protein YyaL (SSP411 family)
MTHSNNTQNRLGMEKSPYLHQHATNPVDWFPWGEEAFEKAQREDKPIFLSIGYSTCHWCHVMEEESFRDSHVAELLNTHFISIKVDREEHPDVDSVYMTVCTALTGAGGWPLTILMTPEKKPFYAGTYFSRENMTRLLTRMEHLWKHSRTELYESGDAIERYINTSDSAPAHTVLDGNTVLRAVEMYDAHYDEKHGGFGGAPKFPSPHNLLFLLEYDRLSGSDKARLMSLKTLEHMYRGGIFDHVAGGFSRYSTDEKWLVPHFEKMLYDNALLAWTYLTAYEQYQAEFCRTAAQKILSWAFAELMHEGGGFYCGQDADSDGIEGRYYLLGHDEIESVLNEKHADIYRKHYGMTKRGHHGGKCILNLLKNARYNEVDLFIDGCNSEIYEYRRKRAQLHTDTKVLTSWNSLMIIALVKAYQVLGDASYLEAARKTERFISERLTFAGRLFVRWCADDIRGNGKLDDYANYSLALIHLHKATRERDYLLKAIHYADVMVQRFFDFSDFSAEPGGFFMYADDDEQLISRPKEIYDGAMPSGNSTAFMVLAELCALTGEAKWHELYQKQLRFISSYAEAHPMGCPFTLITVLRDSAGRSCQGGKCEQ